MAQTPPIRRTVRFALGVSTPSGWAETGTVEIPVEIHASTEGRPYASLNLSQGRVDEVLDPEGPTYHDGYATGRRDEAQARTALDAFQAPVDPVPVGMVLDEDAGVLNWRGVNYYRREAEDLVAGYVRGGVVTAPDSPGPEYVSRTGQAPLVASGVEEILEPPAKRCPRCSRLLRPVVDAAVVASDGAVIHAACVNRTELPR